MHAVFSMPATEEAADAVVVATVAWTGTGVEVESDDGERRAALTRAFRSTPVVTDDAAYRRLGTHGEVQIAPGTLEWFRAAALIRAPAETGLAVRLVPDLTSGGFDPAANYRTFGEQMEHLDADARDRGPA
jgi:hypothetical protein